MEEARARSKTILKGFYPSRIYPLPSSKDVPMQVNLLDKQFQARNSHDRVPRVKTVGQGFHYNNRLSS